MRKPTTFDPRYLTHARPAVNGFMLAYGQVFKPTGEEVKWVPGQGNLDNAYTLVWEGRLRVQPNIDWRARSRDFAGEWDATMATRINMPMHENYFGAVLNQDGTVKTFAADPVFALGDVVVVTKVNGQGQRTLLNKRYTVRNALPSTNMWEHDLLTDVGTSIHG
jgi:hypothetical protein